MQTYRKDWHNVEYQVTLSLFSDFNLIKNIPEQWVIFWSNILYPDPTLPVSLMFSSHLDLEIIYHISPSSSTFCYPEHLLLQHLNTRQQEHFDSLHRDRTGMMNSEAFSKKLRGI